VITSNDPTDGASASWNVKNVDGSEAIFSVSCPSTSLCVAGDNNEATSSPPRTRRTARRRPGP
jgi:hypothetical protein